MTKLVILGRKSQTGNYETFFSKLPARTVTTLVPGEVTSCDALIPVSYTHLTLPTNSLV